MSFYRVCFENEAPRIGAGWRTVFLEHEGRKWVRLRCPVSGVSASLSKPVWQALCRTATPASPRAATIRAALKDRARSLRRKLSRHEHAMIAAATAANARSGARSGARA